MEDADRYVVLNLGRPSSGRNGALDAGECTAVAPCAWVDLNRRKLIAPDESLREVWHSLEQTENFEVLRSRLR